MNRERVFRLFCAFLAIFFITTRSLAHPINLYEGVADVEIMERSLKAPLIVSADNQGDQLAIQMRLGIDGILLAAESFLEKEIEKNNGCRERWSAWSPNITIIDDNKVSVSIRIRVEKWLCESFIKTRLARETVTVRAVLSPTLSGGHLSMNVVTFSLSDLSSLAQQFGVEDIARRMFEDQVRDLNDNPKFHTVQERIMAAGYHYKNVSFHTTPDQHSELIIEIFGPNKTNNILQLMAVFQ